jgi:hypothetical protein
MKGAMSAIGPQRISLVAPHMPALGGNADMTCCGWLWSWWRGTAIGATRVLTPLYEAA